jgi:hypothetical protein
MRITHNPDYHEVLSMRPTEGLNYSLRYFRHVIAAVNVYQNLSVTGQGSFLDTWLTDF